MTIQRSRSMRSVRIFRRISIFQEEFLGERRVAFFPGSTIGNFETQAAAAF